jgi:hypothetical protein
MEDPIESIEMTLIENLVNHYQNNHYRRGIYYELVDLLNSFRGKRGLPPIDKYTRI